MPRQRIVIVGASVAGATAAVTLRDEGFDGDIRLIGAEPQLPYNRPPLSKGYLRQQESFEAQLVKPAGYYTEQSIEVTLGVRATAVDATQKLVELEGGERVAYDQLLVATGGRNRTLSVPGASLGGVFQLRTVEDCDRIRAVIRRGRRAVVMGFGFIGSEVSASLRQLGGEVAAVEGSRVPLARVLGEEVGQYSRASIASRAWSCSRKIPWRRSKAPAVSNGCAPGRGESSSAIWWWPASGSCPTPSCWQRRGGRSATPGSAGARAGQAWRTALPSR